MTKQKNGDKNSRYSLVRSSPLAQGIDPAAIERCIDAIQSRQGLELHGLMILRHGCVVAESSWKPYQAERPSMLFSLSKSFTSTALGFAVAEGLLTVEDPVLSFFREEAPEKPGRYWDELKVKHLLSMNTGHEIDTTGFMLRRRDGDWVKGFLARPIKYKPGTHFMYNTGASYMLSVIVQKLTGQRVLDYLTPRLFEPLGIEGADWEQCPKGFNTGGFGLSLTTEHIARFGQFLLQRGSWQGRQLLPAEWVDEATRIHSDNSGTSGNSDWTAGYGYQFWRCVPDCYRGDGAFGQYCIVIPRLDTVIAVTSGVNDMQAVLTQIWNILLPGIDSSEPGDLAAEARLKQKLSEASYQPPMILAASEREASLSGASFVFEKNAEKLNKLKFDFSPDVCRAEFTYGKNKILLPFGRTDWLEGIYPSAMKFNITCRQNQSISTAFTWEDKNTLLLTSRFLGSPFVVSYRAVFGKDGLTWTSAVNVSFGPTQLFTLNGKYE